MTSPKNKVPTVQKQISKKTKPNPLANSRKITYGGPNYASLANTKQTGIKPKGGKAGKANKRNKTSK
jgi:hypothetical protein